jgi:hypothetical protein
MTGKPVEARKTIITRGQPGKEVPATTEAALLYRALTQRLEQIYAEEKRLLKEIGSLEKQDWKNPRLLTFERGNMRFAALLLGDQNDEEDRTADS